MKGCPDLRNVTRKLWHIAQGNRPGKLTGRIGLIRGIGHVAGVLYYLRRYRRM